MSENATVTVAWEFAHPLLEGHVLDVSVSNELVTPRQMKGAVSTHRAVWDSWPPADEESI
jgi:non-ribosomal peptide synthetase component F